MFEHTGFTGETIGQPYGILVCNKSHLKIRISRGQRLGILCQEVDWAEIFNNLDAKEEDKGMGNDVDLPPGGISLSRKTHQGKEEDLNNCDAMEEGMNMNDDVCPGMEEWFVKTTLC